jgi:tape measure domain-containing protein
MAAAAAQAQPSLRGMQTSLGGVAQGAIEVAASQAGLPPAFSALATGATGAIALGAGLAVAAGFSVSAANEMETLKKQLTLVTGGAGAADAAFKQLQQYAQISPFETTEVVNAGKQLAAFGFTTAQAVEFTKRLGDVSAATGTDIGGLVLNLGQIQSRGFANLVDINQFLQRGIPLWDLLTQATGKTRAELQALEGGIPADAILSAFRLLTDAGGAYFQASETGVTALDREWATLIDTIKLAAIPLGALLAPAIVDSITGAAKGVAEWGRAFDILKAKAETVASNPIVAKLLGIDGKIAGTIVGAIQDQLPFAQIQNAISRLAGQAPKQGPTTIPTTAADLAKLRAQEENRAALAAKIAEQQEKERIKAEKERQKQAQEAARRVKDAQQQQVERLKNIQSVKDLLALQSKLNPGGQGLAIAGINPQTVGQVQQVAATLDLAGQRVAQSLVQGATRAGQELLKARDQLQQAERAAFDLLKNDAQRELKANALDTIRKNLPKTRLDEGKVEQALGIDLQGGLQTAIDNVDTTKLFQISDQVLQNAEASVNLKAATEANTKAIGDLVTAYANAATVNVTVPAGSAVGGDAQIDVRYN